MVDLLVLFMYLAIKYEKYEISLKVLEYVVVKSFNKKIGFLYIFTSQFNRLILYHI